MGTRRMSPPLKSPPKVFSPAVPTLVFTGDQDANAPYGLWEDLLPQRTREERGEVPIRSTIQSRWCR